MKRYRCIKSFYDRGHRFLKGRIYDLESDFEFINNFQEIQSSDDDGENNSTNGGGLEFVESASWSSGDEPQIAIPATATKCFSQIKFSISDPDCEEGEECDTTNEFREIFIDKDGKQIGHATKGSNSIRLKWNNNNVEVQGDADDVELYFYK